MENYLGRFQYLLVTNGVAKMLLQLFPVKVFFKDKFLEVKLEVQRVRVTFSLTGTNTQEFNCGWSSAF